MKWIARLRMFLVASAVAGTAAMFGMVPVSAGGCGESGCKPWSPPAPVQNGLPMILALDAAGVVVLGVLLVLVARYRSKRRSRLGKAEQ